MNDTDLQATRRDVGTVAATGTVAVAGALSSARSQTAAKTFVLVHGAWHGGWCWRRVADRLERKGHKVFTPTLTGLGERSHLLSKDVNLGTHVADVVNLVSWEGLKDIVLVGHSYAGFVITQVAEQIGPSIASIVFLDAFYPKLGESLTSLASPGTKKALEDAAAKGDTVIKPIPAAAFNVNEKDRAWVDSLCTPHPLGTFVDKVAAIGGRETIARRSYIRAAAYDSPSFDAALASVRAAPGWRTYEVPSGHDVMVDMPDRLVEILLEVA